VAAQRWPRRVALRAGTDQWSFADLNYAATEIAGRVRAGSRVAFRAAMNVASVATIWGVPRGGGVAVPIDPALDAPAAAALADSLGATLGWPPPVGSDDVYPEPTPQRPVVIAATSGTGGTPRGVVLTAGNVEAAASASQIHLGTRESDVWLLAMPLHHVGGLAILWRAAHDGSQVVLNQGFEAAAVRAALDDGITWVSFVPTMLRRLLAAPGGPWPSLRGALIGGAHAATELIEAAGAAGVPALPTYGMTETTAQACTVRPGNAAAAAGTVGHPLPGVEVTIDASPGVPGVISIAGPTVSPGYVDEPPRGGPFVTSDVGYFDPSGRLVVLGRNDDVVMSGGEKVHPGQLERALLAQPGVLEAVVFGLPDDEWGERVVAVVAGDDLAGDDLKAILARSFPRHAVPKVIRVVSELPRLSNGKADRAAVRRSAASW